MQSYLLLLVQSLPTHATHRTVVPVKRKKVPRITTKTIKIGTIKKTETGESRAECPLHLRGKTLLSQNVEKVLPKLFRYIVRRRCKEKHSITFTTHSIHDSPLAHCMVAFSKWADLGTQELNFLGGRERETGWGRGRPSRENFENKNLAPSPVPGTTNTSVATSPQKHERKEERKKFRIPDILYIPFPSLFLSTSRNAHTTDQPLPSPPPLAEDNNNNDNTHTATDACMGGGGRLGEPREKGEGGKTF